MRSAPVNLVTELPLLREPITVVFVDTLRDGGSIVVVLEDADAQQITLVLDSRRWSSLLCKLYLGDDTLRNLRPVAHNSPAEQAIFRILRRHLNAHYSSEEQERLLSLDSRQEFRHLNGYARIGYLLLTRLQGWEERRKLATFGVVSEV